MNDSPYRSACPQPPPEVLELPVHVTNVAFVVLAQQRYGWRLTGAVHTVAGQQILRFER
jgi:hypothetical protein